MTEEEKMARKKKNNPQGGKRVSAERKPRLGSIDLDELAIDRRRARQTMRRTAQVRWAKTMSQVQSHRRELERLVRDGKAPTPAHGFWYVNDTMITVWLYLAWKTFAEEKLTKSQIQEDLAVSQPFVSKLVKTGLAGGFIDEDLLLTEPSLTLYFERIDALLDLPELRDLADVIHILNTAENKPERLD